MKVKINFKLGYQNWFGSNNSSEIISKVQDQSNKNSLREEPMGV